MSSLVDALLAGLAHVVVAVLQALPLIWVARIGRFFGGVFYFLDARHRRMAHKNLQRALKSEKTAFELRAIAKENFKRIGENFCSAVKTASMSPEELHSHVECVVPEKVKQWFRDHPKGAMVAAIGHFGNFEIYARLQLGIPGIRTATTYRGLEQPRLNRLLLKLRENSGCLFFERRQEGTALKEAMSEGHIIVGLLGDQHAGNRGLPLPFFGDICSTSPAPAVFALRYHAPLILAICYRKSIGSWQIELGDWIETEVGNQPRPVEEIMEDVNRGYEAAIRRDPANWFWVHNRWKPGRHRKPKPLTKEPHPTEPLSDESVE